MPVHTCNLQAINAMGRSDLFLKLELIKKSYGLLLLVAAVLFFDSPIAIALSGAVSTLISCFVNAYPNKKLIDYSYTEQIKDISPAILFSAVMLGAVWLIARITLPPLITVMLQVVGGIVVYLTLSLIFRPKGLLVLLAIFKKADNDQKGTIIHD